MSDLSRMTDSFNIAMERARSLKDGAGIVGYGVVEHRDYRGWLINVEPFANLITDNGDLYYATRAIAAVSPAAPSDVATKVSRMKLGTGVTAAAKSGAGAVLVTWLNTSVFDASFPATVNLGGGLGVEGQYKTTWAAGTATNSAITEATISTDTTGAVGLASDTVSRVTFGAVNKGASDTLAITWNHKFLGS